MSPPDLSNIISLTVTKFPQNLLIPNAENAISFQVVNNSQKKEHFEFAFKGENFELKLEPEEFKKEIEFKPGEIKNINLNLTPIADGYGKLIINIAWLKIVEYKVKVQKVRETISSSKINKILKNKQLPSSYVSDGFEPKDYLSSIPKNELKRLEKQIISMKENLTVLNASENGSQQQKTLEKIDDHLKTLAKGYLMLNDYFKALETALQLSNESERNEFYYKLIRAHSSVNLDNSIQIIKSLNDQQRKNELVRTIALDYVDINPQQINYIIGLVEESATKQDTILDIIGKLLNKDPQLSIQFANLIVDEFLKVKVLFNIIKKLHFNKKYLEISYIVRQINHIILNSNLINVTDQNNNIPAYDYIKDSICVLAEVDCPESAETLIKGITSEALREKISKDLFNVIYEMVDEVRTKIEPTTVFSQYYLLNIYSSKVTNEVKNFSLVGGNISNNLLSKEYDFSSAFISLFSLDFSIFPIIDRVYADLKYNAKKSIAYYIYPTTKNHDSDEQKIMQSTLKQFLPSHSISNRTNIFNLDFIPYLGKPTIIVSSDRDDVESLKSKINKDMGDRVNILIDDFMFKGGTTYDNLKELFLSNNIKLYNLILSYEFINDYELLKAFMQSVT